MDIYKTFQNLGPSLDQERGDARIFQLSDLGGTSWLGKIDLGSSSSAYFGEFAARGDFVHNRKLGDYDLALGYVQRGSFEYGEDGLNRIHRGYLTIETQDQDPIRLRMLTKSATCFYYLINTKELAQDQEGVFSYLGLDLKALMERLASPKTLFVRGDGMVQGIFHHLAPPRLYKKTMHRIVLLGLLAKIASLDGAQLEGHIEISDYQVQEMERARQALTHDLADLTIEDLADHFHMSSTKLKEDFKAVYGRPIKTYLREYKVNQGAKLLDQTQMTVAEIAFSLGYDNPSNFSRAFKEDMGLTPSEYRKKMRIEKEAP